jgi:hypothetical protein
MDGREAVPAMRAFAAATLLLLALLAMPAASAHDQEGENVQCRIPDPSGSPNSVQYFVTSRVHDAQHTECTLADESADLPATLIDFVVECLVGGQC